MTREVVVVAESDRLRTAESLLSKHGVRHLPVVRDGKLVGVFSQRDLLRAQQDKGVETAMWVGEAMTREVKTVRPDASLKDALHTMRVEKLGCLVVTDTQGKVEGIITEADAVRFGEELAGEADLREEAAEYEA